MYRQLSPLPKITEVLTIEGKKKTFCLQFVAATVNLSEADTECVNKEKD